MSTECPVSGKKVAYGNNVSHANNKTRRRFGTNLQSASFFSDHFKSLIRLRMTTTGMRTVEKKGGIDAYVMESPSRNLHPRLRSLKRSIFRERAKKNLAA